MLDTCDNRCIMPGMAPNLPASARMADRLMGGTLKDELARYRKAKTPWEVIARLLHDEHGVEATPRMLQSWAQTLDVPEPEKAAS